MTTVGSYEAKNPICLSCSNEWLAANRILITRHGQAVAMLVPAPARASPTCGKCSARCASCARASRSG